MGRYEIDFLVDYTDDALLAELRRVAALLSPGTPLTIAAYERLSPKVSHDTLSRRFGGWGEVLKRAGLGQLSGDYSARKLTDERCFENLAAVWTHYGRSPKRNEMLLPPSVIQHKTYLTRWGTWRKSLKAFADWANSEASSESIRRSSQPTETTTQKARSQAECREVRPGLRFKAFRRDHFRCLACGRSPAMHLNIELHADHIVSVADGGKTTLENLQTLCQDCNLGKGRPSMK